MCELWAGSGNLAKAAEQIGFDVDTFELFDSEGRRQDRSALLIPDVLLGVLDDIAARKWVWLHLGISCKTFSIMQFSCGGTRTYQKPWGDHRLEREKSANAEVRAMLAIIWTCIAHGVDFTIEKPLLSILWCIPQLADLINQGCAQKFEFDLCAHGLKSPSQVQPTEYYKKPTALLSSFLHLHSLCVRCSGAHLHTSLGRRTRFRSSSGKWTSRIEFAATYPKKFGRRLAQLALTHVRGQTEQNRH
jgi:hypothetical protein